VWIGIEKRGSSVFISIQLEGAVRRINKIIGLGVKSNKIMFGRGGPAGREHGHGKGKGSRAGTYHQAHITGRKKQ
jgi:hypothetical protein